MAQAKVFLVGCSEKEPVCIEGREGKQRDADSSSGEGSQEEMQRPAAVKFDQCI